MRQARDTETYWSSTKTTIKCTPGITELNDALVDYSEAKLCTHRYRSITRATPIRSSPSCARFFTLRLTINHSRKGKVEDKVAAMGHMTCVQDGEDEQDVYNSYLPPQRHHAALILSLQLLASIDLNDQLRRLNAIALPSPPLTCTFPGW